MNKRKTILLFGVLFFALPVFALIQNNSHDFRRVLSFEKCSAVIEGLKVCVESSEITVNSGEPVTVNLTWINSSDIDRRIGTRSSNYSVTINNEKGEKLLTVLQQQIRERQKRMNAPNAMEEDKKGFIRMISRGSSRSIYVEPNQTETDQIQLTESTYDYDLTNKGKYKVTISKTVPSLEEGKTIEFVIEGIEIKVK